MTQAICVDGFVSRVHGCCKSLIYKLLGSGVISSIGIDGSGYKEFETGGRLIDALACSDSVVFWVTVNGIV